MIILRPDQADLEQRIYNSWNAGARNTLAVAPTGFGKSIVLGEIISKKNMLGAVQCVGAHRTELVDQLSGHIARRGIPHRIIAPKNVINRVTAKHRKMFGRSFVNPDANCAVAAVDTLNARADQLKEWAKQVDDWTIDEAHHVLAKNKWGKFASLFPNAKGLGVTASPRRADGMGLGAHHDGVFNDIVIGPTMRELIEIGALCDYEIAIPESDFEISEDDLAPSGDWSTARMREASKKSHIVGDVVREYVARAYGKQFILFATDVKTAGEMALKFQEIGIPVAAVSAETPDDVRDNYVERFRAGQLWGLINVDLFGEGFDVPAVEVVIMARPTASLAVYLQQFGRALRVMPGKLFGLVIDHVSNWKRHGFPDKPHFWSLDRREKRAKRDPDPELIDELIRCRQCAKPYLRPLPACPWCGTAPPLPDPANRTLEMVDGDLILLDRDKLAQMRAAIELESPASVGQRIAAGPGGQAAGVYHVNRQIERHQAQQRLSGAIAQWAGLQRYRGRSDQESYRRFYVTVNTDVLTALTLPTKNMQDIAAMVEGWCHS